MQLHPASHYVHQLRRDLPATTFAPAPSRLWWLPVHLTIVALAIAAFAGGHVPWLAAPLVSLIIGTCMAGITFLGHETLHGGVVRGRRLRHVIGWICFLPFTLSPRLWLAWHNREHHGNTNRDGHDPDQYPVLEVYEGNRAVRAFVRYFSLGRKRWMGTFSLLFGFTGQSTQMLMKARQYGFLDARAQRQAFAETLLGVAVWLAIAFVVGPLAFLFVFLLPLILANVWVMSFIVTNHSLSPLTDVNDPLANSLSVTVPRAVDWLTLGFGYHVEHHLFPAMSNRHAPAVRDAIRARWPERYQSLPITEALRRLHATSRVYADNVTLIDPNSGTRWSTLLPGPAANQA